MYVEFGISLNGGVHVQVSRNTVIHATKLTFARPGQQRLSSTKTTLFAIQLCPRQALYTTPVTQWRSSHGHSVSWHPETNLLHISPIYTFHPNQWQDSTVSVFPGIPHQPCYIFLQNLTVARFPGIFNEPPSTSILHIPPIYKLRLHQWQESTVALFPGILHRPSYISLQSTNSA